MCSVAVLEAGITARATDKQVDLLIFDGPPQTPDEDVAAPGVFLLHADRDLVGGQHRKVMDVNAALICVENLGPAVPRRRRLHNFCAEAGLRRDRPRPCRDAPGELVQHGSQADETRAIPYR